MAYWKTKSNSFTVNINERLIRAMKNKGARFCKMSDNSDIDNENSSWWMDVATEKNDEDAKTNGHTSENTSGCNAALTICHYQHTNPMSTNTAALWYSRFVCAVIVSVLNRPFTNMFFIAVLAVKPKDANR